MVHIIQKLRPSPSLCTVAQTARITAQTAAQGHQEPKIQIGNGRCRLRGCSVPVCAHHFICSRIMYN
eukprot:2407436-Prymnesium_polylepis.1